jgi:hypothetical protein
MSGAPVATEERTSRRQQAQAPGVQEGSTGPRDIPGAGSRPHQGSRQQQQHDNAGAGSCDRRRSSGCGNGDGGGGGGRGRRYGQWPPATAGGGGAGGSTGSSPATGHRRPSGQHGGSRRGGFSWPAHMDRAELQQAMKRGRVFRWGVRWLAGPQQRPAGVRTVDRKPPHGTQQPLCCHPPRRRHRPGRSSA